VNLLLLWRARAEAIEPYAPPVARAIRDCADELEALQKSDASDLVSLAEGAILSGYDADSLGRMIRSGRLVNHGNKRRPKVKRSDLPRIPGYHALDLDGIAISARARPSGK
jgi:hypothetical protein